jgi:cytochrome b561
MAYRYPTAARALHWLTAALLVAMFVLGAWITAFEPKDEAFKLLLYDIHESTGIALFAIVLLRLLRRLGNPPAPLPSRLPAVLRFAAHANHGLLYLMLLVQPVLGFLATNAWGFPVTWAGLVPIPSPIAHDERIAPVLSTLHWYGALTLLVLIGAHLSGAAYHGLIRRDGVVQRML